MIKTKNVFCSVEIIIFLGFFSLKFIMIIKYKKKRIPP